jgi:hypothetical protein
MRSISHEFLVALAMIAGLLVLIFGLGLGRTYCDRYPGSTWAIDGNQGAFKIAQCPKR